MSEYVLKVEDDRQAEALLNYLRSLDFVELLPRQTTDRQEAMKNMTTFLFGLPNRTDYTQEEVNKAMNELRANRK